MIVGDLFTRACGEMDNNHEIEIARSIQQTTADSLLSEQNNGTKQWHTDANREESGYCRDKPSMTRNSEKHGN